MDISKIRSEIDMLQGNINRMCVTTDEKELKDMRDWAKRRIDNIFNCCQDKIRKGQTNKKDGEDNGNRKAV
jgi:hypothetical protein